MTGKFQGEVMKLVDTHAHLDFPELLHDLDGVFSRARERFVVHIVTVGIDMESSVKSLELARSYPHVSATAGIHPHAAHELTLEEEGHLRALVSNPEVVAVGEIGLDYYRDRQPRHVQRKCFAQQLDIAVDAKKPTVFHIRDAFDDFFSVVKPVASKLVAAVVHCFSGDWDIARKCLDLGFYISVPGVVTYPKAFTLQDVVKKLPVDRMLFETDAPFLAPVPYRGKSNEPSYVYYTAEKVAEIRQEALDFLVEQTTQNAVRAFGISLIN